MKKVKKILFIIVLLAFLGTVLVFTVDLFVRLSTKNQILNVDNIKGEYDAIIVLGAGIQNGKPSPMLKERLDKGIELYKEKKAPKIIMSGDHGKTDHDEVNVMKEYAIENGVTSSDIFMDHAGFSTYDSIYRAKHIFGVKSSLIVTQKYHLFRSLYIAKSFNIDAIGVDAEVTIYSGHLYRELREVLARNKDFVMTIFKPSSSIGGEKVSLSTDGNVTNDKKYMLIKEKDKEKEHKYISSSSKIESIESIIKKDDFIENGCSKDYAFTLLYSTGEIYGLEIDDKVVHVIYGEKEKILNTEDSKFFLDLLNIT